jgi:monofunctional biosynthetic peptidoglycan transglycosylase
MSKYRAAIGKFLDFVWTMTRRTLGWMRFRPKLTMLLLLLCFIFWFVPPVWNLKFSTITVTRWVKSKGKITATVGPKAKGWTSYNRISRHTIDAVIAAEDGKFLTHHGIDWESMLESVRHNWKKKRYARGGSTITQQVVKMGFLSRDKTLIRKAREAVGALLLELIYDKRDILEWYLNMVEFGDAIYGIEAAAKAYYGTKPEMITTSQSIHLALVLPSPNRWSAGLRKRSLTPFGQRRFGAIATNMFKGGKLSKQEWQTAIATGNFGGPIAGYASVLNLEPGREDDVRIDPRSVMPAPGEQEEAGDREDDNDMTPPAFPDEPPPMPKASSETQPNDPASEGQATPPSEASTTSTTEAAPEPPQTLSTPVIPDP